MRGLKAFEANTHTSHPSVGIITQGLAELYYHRRIYDKAEAMARRSAVYFTFRSISSPSLHLKLLL